MQRIVRLVDVAGGFVLFASSAAAGPCGDESANSSSRAEAALRQMTQPEKLSLVHGGLAAPWGGRPKPEGAIGSAGFIPGIPRLGVPALQETDAELGVANPGNIRPGDTATAMPSDLALASSWDLALARRQGESGRRRSPRRGDSTSCSAGRRTSSGILAGGGFSSIFPRTPWSPA